MAERKAEGAAKQKEVEARKREEENSFESVAREWWKWWLIGKSPRHADTTMRRLEADVFPAYGQKSINEVTAADVRLLMVAVEKRDARDIAKRIHETTSQVFRFAIARDIAIRNRPQISGYETFWLKRRPRTALAWIPRNYPSCS